MAVLEVLRYPDARLKQLSSPVRDFDDDLRRFVADLLDTLRSFPGCVGLAAPQVNRFQRIVAVDVSGKPKIKHHGLMVLINPEIVQQEGETLGREGCLSVPDYTGNVARAERVVVQAQDVHGAVQLYECEAYEARAVQHEMDHLEGMLFLDRVVNAHTDLFRRKVYKK